MPDITFDKPEAGPLFWGNKAPYFIEILFVASGKIVQPHHSLLEFEECFQQIATDETGDPGDQPATLLGLQASKQLFVCTHLVQSLPSTACFGSNDLTSYST